MTKKALKPFLIGVFCLPFLPLIAVILTVFLLGNAIETIYREGI